MPKHTDSLRGYGFEIHQRDSFSCRYCGLDGTKSFDSWLALSIDHLLPKSHPKRNESDYIVTACHFCNTADNRYFDLAEPRGLHFDDLTPDQLVEQMAMPRPPPRPMKTPVSASTLMLEAVS